MWRSSPKFLQAFTSSKTKNYSQAIKERFLTHSLYKDEHERTRLESIYEDWVSYAEHNDILLHSLGGTSQSFLHKQGSQYLGDSPWEDL